MNIKTLLKFLLLCFVSCIFFSALLFMTIYLFLQSEDKNPLKDMMYMRIKSVAMRIELSKNYQEALKEIKSYDEIWIVNKEGLIIASSGTREFPLDWNKIKKPKNATIISTIDDEKSFWGKYHITLLNQQSETYMVLRISAKTPLQRPPTFVCRA